MSIGISDKQFDMEYICRSMGMIEFSRLIEKLPYPSLLEIHLELASRVAQIDGYLANPERGCNVAWLDKTRKARIALERKLSRTAIRIDSARENALGRLTGRHGGWSSLKDNPTVQARFLLSLIDRLIDPELLDEEESIALGVCRSVASRPMTA